MVWFAIPGATSTATTESARGSGSLVEFIAYIVYRTRSPDSFVFAAMYLLERLKSSLGRTRQTTGHRLFITALLLAWKTISDQLYSNKTWASISRGTFTLEVINRMEREMCCYLRWRLHIDGSALSSFEARLRQSPDPPDGTAPTANADTHCPSRTVKRRKVSYAVPPVTPISSVNGSQPLASSSGSSDFAGFDAAASGGSVGTCVTGLCISPSSQLAIAHISDSIPLSSLSSAHHIHFHST